MATPGSDCHMTLQHASVNGGVAVGFIVKADRRGPVVEVERLRQGLPVWADQGAGRRTLRGTILALPRLIAPNGGEYGLTPSQVRTYLDAFWAVTTPLILADALGSLSMMWAAAGLTERRYGDGVEFEVRLMVV